MDAKEILKFGITYLQGGEKPEIDRKILEISKKIDYKDDKESFDILGEWNNKDLQPIRSIFDLIHGKEEEATPRYFDKDETVAALPFTENWFEDPPVIKLENASQDLRPGMTANVTFNLSS